MLCLSLFAAVITNFILRVRISRFLSALRAPETDALGPCELVCGLGLMHGLLPRSCPDYISAHLIHPPVQ